MYLCLLQIVQIRHIPARRRHRSAREVSTLWVCLRKTSSYCDDPFTIPALPACAFEIAASVVAAASAVVAAVVVVAFAQDSKRTFDEQSHQ
jgi:hypothetical protein